uniref:HNH endonuclease signature motif containing protein n=1 Tax=Microtetraspora malaysiensis TaxID=161358 RepID=UPI000A9DF345
KQGPGQARGQAQAQAQSQSQGRGRGADWATPGGLISGRTLPGLLLATGQLLPVTDIHRLAQTSGLTRLVMDADGCVLDVGRTARRATRRQRRAILTRYTHCMVDHCPMPAHLCQIDHITNWSDGGTTDLDNLGPTCQFHNRDRYRNPTHYQLHRTGKNRWGFTYLGPRPQGR